MSPGIWLLSTRGRPAAAQETIEACMDAGMTQAGVVYVDETVETYAGLRLPANWTMHCEPEWRSLQGSLGWCLATYPAAAFYGWLADDVRPRTAGWDLALSAAAGDWGLSYARDLWISEDPVHAGTLPRGRNLSSAPCWGGALVRAVGWWALPGVRQAGIDTAWVEIVWRLGLHRYCPEVVVEHLNWRTGKRAKDETDSWERNGEAYVEKDINRFRRWRSSSELGAAVERVRAAMDGKRLSPPPAPPARGGVYA